jgi:cation/acetate symporter
MIMLSPETFIEVYKLPASSAPLPISQPAIFSVPISFLVLIVVSLFTKKHDIAAV